LLHHPDKRVGTKEENEDDDYFACITKGKKVGIGIINL
jgi:hypothetical protein